jgi:hypothetical protein
MVKRKYAEKRDWAKPILRSLLAKELIEADALGHYRFKPPETTLTQRIPVSPQVAQILKSSGKNFGNTVFLHNELAAEVKDPATGPSAVPRKPTQPTGSEENKDSAQRD